MLRHLLGASEYNDTLHCYGRRLLEESFFLEKFIKATSYILLCHNYDLNFFNRRLARANSRTDSRPESRRKN